MKIPHSHRSSDIATASIGPRSTVATGPEEIQASKWELEADTEKFIQVAEVMLTRVIDLVPVLNIKVEHCLPVRMDDL